MLKAPGHFPKKVLWIQKLSYYCVPVCTSIQELVTARLSLNCLKSPKRLCMRIKKTFLHCFLFIGVLLQASLAFAQNATVTGTVTDAGGKPVPGATVAVKGTSVSAAADAAGVFTVAVPAGSSILIISSVGYVPQEVDVTGKTNISISLSADSQSLEDVVVVGYGTVRRKDATGAVASIGTKDFSAGVINNPMQQIAGKVAGLTITIPNGDPNADLTIRLRGQTSLSGGQTPLIVLDGIPLDDPNQIASIPPGDIASYDVLKDVSATAIYGSRGANGVIIINTKKGTAGRTRVEYNGYIAFDKMSNNYDLANSSEWRQAAVAAGINQSTIDGLDKGANTDWSKAITRNAFTHSHNVAIAGGANGFNYRASVTFMDQEGVVINSGKQQFGARFNAQQKALNNKLDLKFSVLYNENKQKYTDYAIFAFINTALPTYPVYNPDGSYYEFSSFEQQNPVARQELQTNEGRQFLTQILGSADYELIRGLKIGTLGSISRFNIQRAYFQPTLPGIGNLNNASQSSANVNSKKGDLHANYIKDIGKHNLNATAVYEFNQFNNYSISASGQDFLVPELGPWFLGGGNPNQNIIGSVQQEFKIISFLGRLAYNYDGKYYATASFRRDGSSKFGVNERWGNFPSASVAWRIKGESFMDGISWLDDLKLSAGYGVVGNQDAIDPYATELLQGGSTRYYNPANSQYSYPRSYQISQNDNPNLKWEERRGVNIGLNFAVLNNRVTGNINWYNDRTKNLLASYTVPVPPYFYPTILANVGELTNKGVEVQLAADIVRGRDFTWNVGGQITRNRTKIENLSGDINGTPVTLNEVVQGQATGRGYAANYITYLKVGYAPYVFQLAEFAGLDPNATGASNQLYYLPDGQTTASVNAARKKIVDPTARFNYGFNSTFGYKQFGLNFFLRGVAGQKIFNNYQNITSNTTGRLPGNNITKAGLSNGIRGSQTASTLWLENAGFLRMDNATFSYTFNKVKGFETLRAYVTGSNLFVITDYTGQDPEIQVGNSVQSYIDANVSGLGYYPRSRTITIGINVAFK
ncbi:MAG: TonB-dependent receptor [Chitinophagaceae bacterium]|nr:MAG: TonB-dependent receptor [Chitinophagaceae bacterium]